MRDDAREDAIAKETTKNNVRIGITNSNLVVYSAVPEFPQNAQFKSPFFLKKSFLGKKKPAQPRTSWFRL